MTISWDNVETCHKSRMADPVIVIVCTLININLVKNVFLIILILTRQCLGDNEIHVDIERQEIILQCLVW